jgi:hypothetical protein
MGQAERQQLARLLAELDQPPPAKPDLPDPFQADPELRRERRLALVVLTGCCIVLAGWIVVLAATLPHHFDAHHWRAVWVSFDMFLLVAFALTAWALWRERQIVILLLVVVGTMLCCDAWFDVATSLKTSGFGLSLASAAFAELPLAFLAFAGARHLLKATVEAGLRIRASAGQVTAAGQVTEGGQITEGGWPRPGPGRRGRRPSLRHTPLSGSGLLEALPRQRVREYAHDRQKDARRSS